MLVIFYHHFTQNFSLFAAIQQRHGDGTDRPTHCAFVDLLLPFVRMLSQFCVLMQISAFGLWFFFFGLHQDNFSCEDLMRKNIIIYSFFFFYGNRILNLKATIPPFFALPREWHFHTVCVTVEMKYTSRLSRKKKKKEPLARVSQP